jgi:amino acid adenylation domain-containing protein
MKQKNKEIESIYPLSPLQQGLLFHSLAAPDSGMYFIHSSYKIHGHFNLHNFEKAWQTVVSRHAVLRTFFIWEDCQKPLQIVCKSVNLPWENYDWRDLSPVEQQTAVETFLQVDMEKGFQLDRSPLMRCSVIRLSDDEYQFVWSHHHLLIDGWSSSTILKEIFALYGANNKEENLSLPSPRPYKDYVTWLQQQDLGLAKTFWQRILHGFTAPTQLGDMSGCNLSNTKNNYEIGVQQIYLSMTVTRDIQTLVKKYHLTLNTLLQGVWGLLLHHYSGDSTVVFGTTVSGRPADLVGVESMVGLFINTLPVCIKISGAADLVTWLQELLAQQVEREQYAYSSLVDIQKWSDLPRGSSLFESLLVFENHPEISPQERFNNLDFNDLDFNDLETINSRSLGRNNYPLTILAETSPELSLGIGYDSCRFDDATIAQMLEHLQKLLLNIASNPAQSLHELLLSSGLKLSSSKTFLVRTADFDNLRGCSNLTEHQLLIWLGHQFNSGALIYNNALTFTIPTQIDSTHFQAAFQVLINSSDALRTVFLSVDGVPQQEVLPSYSHIVDFVDLSQVTDHSIVLVDLLEKRAQIVFDLEKCLFDTALFKLSQQKFLWYINTHQLIADGLSLSLIFNHISELYILSIHNSLPQIIPLPQFRDYLDYERKYQDSERHNKVSCHWQQKLSEPKEPISFYGKTDVNTTTVARRVSTQLGYDRSQKLQALSRRENSTNTTNNAAIFNIFLAILSIYLHHISGNHRLVIGIPIHNRRAPIFKEMIGSFVQVLPLYIDIKDNDNIQSLLKKIATEISASLRYSQCAIGNPRKNPVYDVILNYHTTTFINFAGSQIDFDWIHTGHSNENLAIQIRDVGLSGDFMIDFDFNCNVFDDKLVDLAIQHFTQVIDSLLEDFVSPISKIDLISERERQHILVELNQTQKNISPQLFTDILAVQTFNTPDRVAVVFENQCVTYAELNTRSNQLARHLRSLGVKPEVLVGVYTERSLNMLVAFLAILKAGGVYVPLDPALPKERLAYILSDSQVSILLTQENLVAELSEQSTHIVCLDVDVEKISKHSDLNLLNVLTSDNLAYIIYTSGSTGLPKGVAIEQRGMLNHLYAKVWDLQLTENDAVAQTAPQSFDISVWQLLVAFLVGARVHIFPAPVVRNPAKLLEEIEQQEISILEVVPSLLQMMLHELELHPQQLLSLPKLRWLILTGEALSPKLCDRWLSLYPTIPMLNAYGPTECSDDVTHYPIYEPLGTETLHTPIGRPIANTQLYILNSQLQPMPMGIAGELYVGGIGVGRGYFNNPELTAKSFIPNPFGASGSRLYKTGDKARYLSDGNIEFLGRIDYQVKIRGFRIELLEIEAVLTQHPAVQESTVIVWEHSGDKQLVSYVVPHQLEAPNLESQLRHLLQERLPYYMMPSAFIMLDSLPLTPNGKVDRRALPAPEKSNFTGKTNFIPPRNSLELQLVSIWGEILNVHPVGVQDNFFEIGGHSLLALQLMAQIQRQIGKKLPLATLLQHPTIEQLASVVSQQADLQHWSPLVAIQPNGDKPPLFFAPGGAMDVIEFYHLAHHLGTDRPFYGMQPRGLDGEIPPHTRIEEMATCYLEAIQKIQPQGPYFLGGHSFGSYIVFEIAQQLQMQGEKVALLALIDEIALIPSLQKPVESTDDASELAALTRLMERFFDQQVELSLDILHELEVDKRLNYLAEKLETANLIPPQAGEKQLQGFLQVSKAVSQAFDLYQPVDVYPDQITFFRSSESNPDDFAGVPEEILEDPVMGWNQFSAKPVEIHFVPGDHITMMTEPHVQVLAEKLKICLAHARSSSGGL